VAAEPTGVRAYARHRTARAARGDAGFEPTSHVAVLKAIAAGRLEGAVEGEGRRIRIDFAKADELWAANTDPAQQRSSAIRGAMEEWSRAHPSLERSEEPSDGKTIAEVRLDLMKWQARRERLTYLRERAKMIPAKDVEKATFEQARRFRNRALELADRVCDRLATETKPARVRVLLLGELRQVLELDAEDALGRAPPKKPARRRARRRKARRIDEESAA
jgi:hypothetical protein